MIFYISLSATSFLLLGFCWSRRTFANALVKFFLLCAGSFGVFLLLQLLGYVVKV